MEDVEISLSNSSLQILSELRQKRQLCDAVLHTEDQGEFEVHRSIMSTCSPYFHALFTTTISSRTTNHFSIPGVSSKIMESIIDYAYSRNPIISWENVQDLLLAADQFNVNGIVHLCCSFLTAEMKPENCIGIRLFAHDYNCPDMEKEAYKYIMANFVQVAQQSKEFLNLPLEELSAILRSEELNVPSEDYVWEAICVWLDFASDARREHIAKLMRCVRLGLVGAEYFKTRIKAHPYVADNKACLPIVVDTLKFLNDIENLSGREDEVTTPEIACPRLPYKILFAIGGWSGGSPTNFIESYDSRADRWIRVSEVDPAGPRAYHKCAVVDYNIYIIGGFDGVVYYSGCRCFNAVTKTWREVAPMNSRRCYVSVAVLTKHVYALGGFDGLHRQNTAERYDHTANQWTYIAPMNQHRSDASSATLRDCIYITGGFNGNECLSSAECYNSKVNQWTMIASMINRRSGVSCTAYHGSIYVLGGFNGMSRLSSGEKYNPRTNSWSAIPDMQTRRSNFAIEVLDDIVFAIGGYNGDTIICQVECYDDKTDQWYEATDMNISRSALAACVVPGLPNSRDYIHKHRDRLLEEKRLRLIQIQQLQNNFQNNITANN